VKAVSGRIWTLARGLASLAAAGALAAGIPAGPAVVQAAEPPAADYPSRPVRWIVPFSPGGPTDVVARVVGQKLAERLRQPVLIENRPGAGGNVGTELVARGPADGGTILMVIPGLVTNPYFMRSSVDPAALEPVIQLTRLALVLLASPRFAPATIPELIAAIKASPGRVSCGASGALPTVGCALLHAHAGAEVLLVQYKGNAPALKALISGEIDLLFDVANTALPQVKAGRVRALASGALERTAGPFAGLPLLSDALSGFDLVSWQGVMVARHTPPAIVARLHEALAATLADTDVRQRLSESGLELAGGSAEAFGEIVRRDALRYGKILTEAGIRPE
jgi:tripartite-type tricarboxylate transporter receptor subunit TctC